MSGVAPSARFYQHGWQSWSATGWRPVDRPVRHPLVEDHLRQATDPARIGGRPGGSAVGAIETGSGEVELLGALDLDGWVWLDDGRLTGDGAGEWFTFRGPESEALAAYARRLGDRFGTRRRESGPVWCSWYSFFRDISEPALLSVLSDLGTLPFSTFQIDDGWQRSNGDWQANAKFPSGMEAFADRIAIEGRTPGLWLAPFLADADSALVARFPQMLLRDEDGAPLVGARNWGGDTYVLDVGRDDVLEWVADLTLTVVGWGYHYLKLDFLYAPALPTSSVDERPREVLYRRALE
ncbi:MAG: alpha-galactosidase, partial [Acidimicrobiia bacterium]|nr:alpha-galactosidase [Acidimicrobiia bacterium]